LLGCRSREVLRSVASSLPLRRCWTARRRRRATRPPSSAQPDSFFWGPRALWADCCCFPDNCLVAKAATIRSLLLWGRAAPVPSPRWARGDVPGSRTCSVKVLWGATDEGTPGTRCFCALWPLPQRLWAAQQRLGIGTVARPAKSGALRPAAVPEGRWQLFTCLLSGLRRDAGWPRLRAA
jgi:hypothetical protein